MKKLVTLGTNLGLNSYESKSYVTLLELGQTTAPKLADSANIPKARIYDVLESLESKGFVLSQPGRPQEFLALSPEQAFSNFEAWKKSGFQDEIDAISSVKQEFVKSFKGKKLVEKMMPFGIDQAWVVKGDSNIYAQLGNKLDMVDSEVYVLGNEFEIEEKLQKLYFKFSELKKKKIKIVFVSNLDPKNEKNFDLVNRIKNIGELKIEKKLVPNAIVIDSEEIFVEMKKSEFEDRSLLILSNSELASYLLKK